ncbi:AraC-like DNA-binding protein [Mobilisporobacter senegalensis]|uniref:AraC-like DNA-binding protein n=1 Tax=Mobilisporobacter senegalensis TaxID=1329262 RepID=A0A3N1XGF3_9FIRM|nr:helix-turn-helix domain-containing protein [Mobilisporobacter senegalensis]ROR25803.1 AraC-like DNA-binding protein [Mobilisporobacter senegalensis]
MNNKFELQNLIDILSYSKKIHISIHYLTGTYQQDPALIVQPANKVHYCKFCNEAKMTKKGLALCMRNKYLSINKAMNEKCQFIGKCYLGITEIVTPVFINDSLFCIVYIGNILIEEDTEKTIRQIQYASGITHSKSHLSDLINELENISISRLDDYIKMADIISGCIHLILDANKDLFQGKRPATHINNRHWLIQQTVEYIEQFYNTDIKLTHISDLFFVNSQYLSRLFSKNMGVTFIEYIHFIRMKEAKKLLIETDNKIIEIAYKVGFNNVTYFNLVFKKNTGLTPFEFRNKHS